MKLFVIGAGVFQMKRLRFLAVILLARVIRYFGMAELALIYGDDTVRLLKQNAVLGIGLAVAVITVFILVHRWSNQRLSEGV
jgi:membrane protein DedA with SNARE-associated domain